MGIYYEHNEPTKILPPLPLGEGWGEGSSIEVILLVIKELANTSRKTTCINLVETPSPRPSPKGRGSSSDFLENKILANGKRDSCLRRNDDGELLLFIIIIYPPPQSVETPLRAYLSPHQNLAAFVNKQSDVYSLPPLIDPTFYWQNPA